jgi:hypothetical protein
VLLQCPLLTKFNISLAGKEMFIGCSSAIKNLEPSVDVAQGPEFKHQYHPCLPPSKKEKKNPELEEKSESGADRK